MDPQKTVQRVYTGFGIAVCTRCQILDRFPKMIGIGRTSHILQLVARLFDICFLHRDEGNKHPDIQQRTLLYSAYA